MQYIQKNQKALVRKIETNIGKELKRIREERGFSQAKLSELSGITINTISRLENDSFTPRFNIVYILLDTMGASLKDLQINLST